MSDNPSSGLSRELQDQRWRLESIIEGTHVGTWEWNVQTGETLFNETWAQMIGYTLAELSPVSIETWTSMAHPDDLQRSRELLARHFSGELPYYDFECRMKHKDGRWIWVHDRGRLMTRTADGEPLMMFGTHTDITERKLAEGERAALVSLVENNTEVMVVKDRHCRIVAANPAFVRAAGCSSIAQLIGKTDADILGVPQDAELVRSYRLDDETALALPPGELLTREELIPLSGGGLRAFLTRKFAIRAASEVIGLGVITTDITERKQAEQERAKLEEQLHQAQKMESVGRLAGGVAHDFNNMLAVILGNLELAMEKVPPDHPIHANLQEISKAAEHSADLTRQLLAFARKQTVAPQVLDLNDTIAGMLKMIVRLIGENVQLRWQPGTSLWAVKMDPSQLDQALANLCVNARDAIADIGQITIETSNVVVDEDFCGAHPGFSSGDFVRLSVSDTGCGMDKETLARVFEPFFTTKDVGKGTGLGLAMVYGIVRQNNGFIDSHSEPGQGTRFTLYLPRHVGQPEQAPPSEAKGCASRGYETILLVEDERAILEFTKTMLTGQGYTVLVASTPGEALRVAQGHDGEIHLLMTDVIMPEMNGRELGRSLVSRHPRLQCVFMSGYSADVIAHHGVLDEGVTFLQKPFSGKDLAAKVRAVLDGRCAGA